MKAHSFSYTRSQLIWMVALRVFIGWHFLYEGIAKMLNPGWSAYPYLMDSQGYFAWFFQRIALNQDLLPLVNYVNIYGLILIGLALILGLFFRWACIGGICFLAMYYLSHPPFVGAEYMMPSEGSYLWVDKNLIEIAALTVLYYFPTSRIVGIDYYVYSSILKTNKQPE